jgi:hypothetical protein
MNAARSGSRDKPLRGHITDAAHNVAGMEKIVNPATRLNVTLLLRGIVCKARKARLESRHGEIHKCADLRNDKPTLRGNQMQGHGGVLVVREKDLQLALRKLLRNMVREKSGDAASFDGRGDGATNAIHYKAWRELNRARDRGSLRRRKGPGIDSKVSHRNDLVLCKISGLFDFRLRGQIARRCRYDAPNLAQPHRHMCGIRQMGNSQSNIYALVDKANRPVQEKQPNRHGRKGIHEGVQDRTQDVFTRRNWSRYGQHAARSRSLARCNKVSFFEI